MHYPEGEELAVNSQRVFLGHTGASDQNPSQIMLRKTVYVTKESKGPARFGQGTQTRPKKLQLHFTLELVPRDKNLKELGVPG